MNSSELNAIITRTENAKRLTDPLLEKTQAFANYIQEQMEELGVGELMAGKYTLRKIKSSVGSDTSLYLSVDDYYTNDNVCLDVCSVSPIRECGYIHNDYSASYNLPNRADIFTFINDAQALLNELAELDQAPDTSAIDSVIS